MPKPQLPPRGSAPDLTATAQRYADQPEAVRNTIATMLVARCRSEWRGTEDEILAAIGYRDANEYWEVALSEPMKVSSFTHLLALHQIDPTERCNPYSPYDRRSRVQYHLDVALRAARVSKEPFFIDGEDLLRPREAAIWLVSKPKRREYVPAGLRVYLKGQEQPGTAPVSKSKRKPKKPSQDQVNAAVLGFAQKRFAKKPQKIKREDIELKNFTEQIGATDRQRIDAWRDLPEKYRTTKGNPGKSGA